MNTHLDVDLAGTRLRLLGDRALYWPDQHCLLIADIHFGKAASFRRLGQPVPAGTTAANLARLDRLLHRHDTRRLVFLGDFLHARHGRHDGLWQALADWRERHPALHVDLVRGNHDRHAGDPPASLGIDLHEAELLLGPFALRHEPDPHPERHVLAGHLHPCHRLRGPGRQSLRLPCFALGHRVSLLPAFGEFTGGLEQPATPGTRLYLCGDGGVWPVPAA
ncbi:DEAD/DEAH box helicase [Pseudomonas sp. 1D4]|uniref:ligase-associated DNA damage response endonuclease PdeM n=1 Tax=Pseudomonadaceae TaxID=135621 RepID=UPI00084BA360|nr:MULTISPECIES: ligase-associated DNA damage response endonuclease PdeM [Pseudomonas]OEC39471.1 DEAD/DEAH box helicase [Pseudomonas sp. 1D4]